MPTIADLIRRVPDNHIEFHARQLLGRVCAVEEGIRVVFTRAAAFQIGGCAADLAFVLAAIRTEVVHGWHEWNVPGRGLKPDNAARPRCVV